MCNLKADNAMYRNIKHVILLIELDSGYTRELVKGITRYSRFNGPWAFFSERGNPKKVMQFLKTWNPNGIIASISDRREAREIIIPGLPAIILCCNKIVNGYPNIIGDWEAEGKLGSEYFLSKGFTKFGYCGFSNLEWSNSRGQAFLNSIKNAGYTAFHHAKPWHSVTDYWQREQDMLCEWIRHLPKPIGILACNDTRGRHVLEACKLENIAVPEQVAVLGVDNDDTICQMTHPQLSSIAVNTEEAGYLAAELLDKMMSGQQCTPEHIVVSPINVVTRQSTDILAVEDNDVAKALNFINASTQQQIHVDDVASYVSIARRGLERKFKKYLNKSIYTCIQNSKMNKICKLLVETDFSVSQISDKLGFCDVSHLTHFFIREMNATPTEYRRRIKGDQRQ